MSNVKIEKPLRRFNGQGNAVLRAERQNAEGYRHLHRDDRHRADLRNPRLVPARSVVPAESEPPAADRAGGDHRHHRGGRHPCDHHHRHRSLLRIADCADRGGGGQPAQTSDSISPMYPGLLDLPAAIPIGAGIGVGIVCGFINGFLITRTGIPPFIATLGMMVSARGPRSTTPRATRSASCRTASRQSAGARCR